MATLFRGRPRRVHSLRAAILVGIAAAVLVGAVFAFTAANTVPETRAGEGTGTVSGFVLSSVSFGLNATDPTKIDSVTFTLDTVPPAGSTIRARLSAAGSWYNCSNVGASVTCDTTSPAATVTGATDLTVVVAQ